MGRGLWAAIECGGGDRPASARRFALRQCEIVTMGDAPREAAILFLPHRAFTRLFIFHPEPSDARSRFVHAAIHGGGQRMRTCGHCPTAAIFTPVGRDVPSRGLCSTFVRGASTPIAARSRRVAVCLCSTGRSGRSWRVLAWPLAQCLVDESVGVGGLGEGRVAAAAVVGGCHISGETGAAPRCPPV